jgi:hypothetical protein
VAWAARCCAMPRSWFDFQIFIRVSNWIFLEFFVRVSSCSSIKPFDCQESTVFCFICMKCLFHLCTFEYVKFVWYLFKFPHHHWLTESISYIMCKYIYHMFHLKFHTPSPSGSFLLTRSDTYIMRLRL